MKLFLLGVIFLSTTLTSQAQDCKAFVPYEEGTKTELTNYDKKGKVTGVVSQQLTHVSHDGNTSTFIMHQLIKDAKGDNPPLENEMTFKCDNGVFYIDMNGFLNNQQMDAYKDMEIKLTMDEIDIPSSYKVGQNLKDGYVKMDVTGSPIPISFTVNIINRLVVAEEQKTTPAGTFDCVKISQDVVTKSIMNMTINSVEWYAEGVGVVRTETYRKGKLMGYSELTKLEKP